MNAMLLLVVRPAVAADQTAIHSLVKGERLNPNGLDWPNFRVAEIGSTIVGTVQMRRHADGSCELGSLVLAKPYRGRGIAALLIGQALAGHACAVHVVTARANSVHYRRWGFRTIAPARAPGAVWRNYCAGQLIGGAWALLRGRAPRRLVILERV